MRGNDSANRSVRSETVLNALTIDLEDWFHILDLEGSYARTEWGGLSSRVVGNTERLLDIMAEAGVRGTFFVLGWIAETYPELVRMVAAAGHEIGSHGYGHELAYEVGKDAFCADTVRSIGLLEDLTGTKVLGYRAAGFSITPGCEWAFECLLDAGIAYDSSLFPSARGHGGWPGAGRLPHDLVLDDGRRLREFPISVLRLGSMTFAFCGGGYFRLFPYPFIRWGIQHLNDRGEPAMVYLHPREIDPGQPRLAMPFLRRIKCYVNLRGTEEKLRALVRGFRWAPAAEVLGLAAQ